MDHLGKLMELGIQAFKIEGRMKGAFYLASVVRSYRQAIDRYWEAPEGFQVDEKWREDLASVSHRPYSGGLLFEDSADAGQGVETSINYVQTHTLAGIVRPAPQTRWEISLFPIEDGEDWTYIEARSRLAPGMELHFLGKDGVTNTCVLDRLQDVSGNHLQVAHPNTWIRIRLPFDTFPSQVIRTSR
jgi:U32 family peptidase